MSFAVAAWCAMPEAVLAAEWCVVRGWWVVPVSCAAAAGWLAASWSLGQGLAWRSSERSVWGSEKAMETARGSALRSP